MGGTFVNPIYVAAPPGDGERLMVVLRDGDIRVIKNGATLAQPFLSIPDVDSRSGSGYEAGLLGMAFSPNYLTSGRFYVYMVADDADPGSDGAPHGPIQIREYKRSAANPEVADPATKRLVLEIPHAQFSNHYGGTLQFGPDGLLYASVGDGGGGGDPNDNAEDTGSRLGKLLRLDPRRLGSAPYRVPPSNPFANGVGGDPLVYSYGLRNPFRFSFDRQTGDLTLGDVGQGTVEEIDFAPSAQGRGLGANFGWNSCEGNLAYPNTANPCTFDHSEPVYTYPNMSCASVTGGVVVRDPGLPALAGKYLFADYCETYLKSLDLALPTATNETTLSVSVPAFGIAGFGEDACGRVHLAHLAASGTVKRLEDDAAPGSCDLTVTYGPPVDEDGGPGGGAPGTPATPSTPAFTFALAGALRQRSLRSGNVGVRLRCSRACSARAVGTLTLRSKGRRVRLRQALGRRSSAGSVTLKLRLTEGGRVLLRGALRARRRVRASVTVRVRDATGRLATRQRTIRLAR